MSLRVSTSRPLMPRLLGRHVQRRADHLGEAGEQRLVGQLLPDRLGHAEVDHLRPPASPSCSVDQDVGRLEVAVDDPLLVRVLHRLADRRRTAPAAAAAVSWFWSQNSVIGTPLTSSITKYGRPDVGGAAVEHLGDVGMVHERQRLPLGLEAGDDLPRVHARLDDLQRHLAADRLRSARP